MKNIKHIQWYLKDIQNAAYQITERKTLYIIMLITEAELKRVQYRTISDSINVRCCNISYSQYLTTI